MFWKKKGMIDVGKMASQGKIKIPKKDYEIPTNKEGFVEISPKVESNEIVSQKKENSGFFDFLGFNSSENKSENNKNNFSIEQEGYSKREVDSKIEELDNKIYKLEQRIELLERKTGIGSGW